MVVPTLFGTACEVFDCSMALDFVDGAEGDTCTGFGREVFDDSMVLDFVGEDEDDTCTGVAEDCVCPGEGSTDDD